VSRRAIVAVGLLVVLVLAGAVSYVASDSPDGLNKVASDTGLDSKAKDHDVEDSPFSGYQTKGAGDGFLSGGLAGVAGVGVTFLLVGGVVWAVRRRSQSALGAEGDPDRSEDSADSREESVRR